MLLPWLDIPLLFFILGDECDEDKDNDGHLDVDDNCIYVKNPDQAHKDLNYDMLCNLNFNYTMLHLEVKVS